MQNNCEKHSIESENVTKILYILLDAVQKELLSLYPEGLPRGNLINYMVSLGSSFLGSCMMEVKDKLINKDDVNFSDILMNIMMDIYPKICESSMHKTSQVLNS